MLSNKLQMLDIQLLTAGATNNDNNEEEPSSSSSSKNNSSVNSTSPSSSMIPTELYQLSRLRTLHLVNCQLSGTISSSLLSKLSDLESLDLSNNNLTSSIPTEIGLLTNLQRLYLYGNNFDTGNIPTTELNQLTLLNDIKL